MFEQSDIQGKIAPDDPWFALIEDAYRVFDYPKPASTEVCIRCCMTPAIEEDFFNPAIRELPLRADPELAAKSMAVAAIIESHATS